MDTNNTTRRLHPLLTVAAVSLTIFSAVGVAAITGLIPTSKGSAAKEDSSIAAVQTQPEAPKAVEARRSADAMPAAQPQATPAHRPAKKHVQVARAATPPAVYEPAPVAAAEAAKPVVKPGLLGTVEAVREVEEKGDAKGVGAVGGGVAGAVLGHNIGDHNKLVTILGAAGGALLGNQIEKQARATKHWEMTVRYDDGTSQVIKSEAQPFWHQGDRVRLYEGKLQPV
ncbi:MAG TPA: glycine zipper 2TM domain-containing protein [Burkholderiales bacterium]